MGRLVILLAIIGVVLFVYTVSFLIKNYVEGKAWEQDRRNRNRRNRW